MWVTASPNPTYGSSILRCRWEDETFFGKVQSPLLRLVSSCTVCCILSHITPFLFDFNDLTFSSTHKSLQRSSAFLGGDLFVNFHNISLHIQIDRTPVAYHVGLCCCSLVLQVHSFARSHLFCIRMWPVSLLCLTGLGLAQSKQN